MTKEDAKQQVEAFFLKLGQKASIFDEKTHVEARIGETVVGFEYDEAEEILSAQALIYRFRNTPKDNVLDAIFGEETDANNGGGRVVFDSENFTFYLQRDFAEKQADESFYQAVHELAQAGLRWSGEILMQAAEKANS